MNVSRPLDAEHMLCIVMRMLRRRDASDILQSDATSLTVSIRSGDSSRAVISINAYGLEQLAEPLRVMTAVDVSANAPEFAELLAKIAILVNFLAPQVIAFEEPQSELNSLSRQIYTEFALECATEFARFYSFLLDRSRTPQHEVSIALLVNDVDILAWVFLESLHAATNGRGDRPDRRPSEPRHAADLEAEAITDGRVVLPRHVALQWHDQYLDRRMTASCYRSLRFIAEVENWPAEAVLLLIDAYLHPNVGQWSVDRIMARLEHWLEAAGSSADSSDVPSHDITAVRYSNLRSTADAENWDADTVLLLIDASIDFVDESQLVPCDGCISGSDWRRLYAWLTQDDGEL